MTLCGVAGVFFNANANTELQPSVSDKVCLALRGNGPRIFAHFGGIAKVVEEIGDPIAAAGGSSASITSFLIESMKMNPALSKDSVERRKQLSLMLKTVEGLVEMIGESKQLAAVNYFVSEVENIRKGMEEAPVDPQQALNHLRSLLNKELAGLVNPEFVAFLANPSTPPAWRLSEAQELINTFGKFSSSDPKILVRPGLINFNKFSEIIGRIGSFYASYAPMKKSEWQKYFDNCSESKGNLWPSFTTECRQQFKTMFAGFHLSAPGKNRQDDMVSGQGDFHSLITTSLTAKEAAITEINTLKNQYFNNSFTGTDANFNFDDFSFGYWGKQTHLDAIVEKSLSENHIQWKKSYSLGQKTWKEALSLSPAEPGLTNALNFRNGTHVSFGGWSNLFPVEVLKALPECEKVVFLTRPGLDSNFARGVAKQIGASEAQTNEIFDLTSPTSGMSRAVQQADYRLCSDWDSVNLNSLKGFSELVGEGYNAPIYALGENGPETGCHP